MWLLLYQPSPASNIAKPIDATGPCGRCDSAAHVGAAREYAVHTGMRCTASMHVLCARGWEEPAAWDPAARHRISVRVQRCASLRATPKLEPKRSDIREQRVRGYPLVGVSAGQNRLT